MGKVSSFISINGCHTVVNCRDMQKLTEGGSLWWRVKQFKTLKWSILNYTAAFPNAIILAGLREDDFHVRLGRIYSCLSLSRMLAPISHVFKKGVSRI